MGKASRSKRERRLLDAEMSVVNRALRSTTGSFKFHANQASTGAQSWLWIGGEFVSAHALMIEAFEEDSVDDVRLIEALIDGGREHLLDFQFKAELVNGSTFTASIYHHAWMLGAFRCFDWLLRRALSERAEEAGTYIQDFFLALERAMPSHPNWERLWAGAEAICDLCCDEDRSAFFEKLRARGGNCSALVGRIESRDLAAAEAEELAGIVDRELLSAGCRIAAPEAAPVRL